VGQPTPIEFYLKFFGKKYYTPSPLKKFIATLLSSTIQIHKIHSKKAKEKKSMNNKDEKIN